MVFDESVLVELRVVVNYEILDEVVDFAGDLFVDQKTQPELFDSVPVDIEHGDVEPLDVEHDNVYGRRELVELDRLADGSISDIPVKQDNPASRNDVIRSYYQLIRDSATWTSRTHNWT